MDVKFEFGLNGVRGSGLFLGSLMSVLLFVSLFSCLLLVGAAGSSLVGPVDSETALVDAVSDAQSSGPVIIALGKSISLSDSLCIPADTDVTLVSDGDADFRLIGANGVSTIVVDEGGVLRLDGVIVTHANGDSGCGVDVASGGTLVLISGVISNNAVSEGAGVINSGTFDMSGGEIFDNAPCGVFNSGTFDMSGGKIFNNIGSGVVVDYNGDFSMTGGEIYQNDAEVCGGGVYVRSSFGVSTFTLSDGMIYNNTANDVGGGVYNEGSIFKMSGGVISNNTAASGAGLYTNGGSVTISGGEISNNTALTGGGVYTYFGIFDMTGGELFNNTARTGGGAFVYGGEFSLTGGKVSNNTAILNGGGIGVPVLAGLDYVYVQKSVVFSDNRASKSYERGAAHDDLYKSHIGSSVTWTKPFNQGYNNYDIWYVSGSQNSDNSSPSSTPGTSSSPSPTNTNPGSPGTASPGDDDDTGSFGLWSIVIIIAIVAGLVIAVLVFYLPKKKNTPVESL